MGIPEFLPPRNKEEIGSGWTTYKQSAENATLEETTFDHTIPEYEPPRNKEEIGSGWTTKSLSKYDEKSVNDFRNWKNQMDRGTLSNFQKKPDSIMTRAKSLLSSTKDLIKSLVET